MEMLAIVVGLLVLLWITGLIKPLRVVSSSLESGAQIAERHMEFTNQSHKAETINRYAVLDINDEAVQKAKEAKQRLSSLDI